MPEEHPDRDRTSSAERVKQKHLAEELKHKHGVDNPYALAWWLTRHDKDKR